MGSPVYPGTAFNPRDSIISFAEVSIIIVPVSSQIRVFSTEGFGDTSNHGTAVAQSRQKHSETMDGGIYHNIISAIISVRPSILQIARSNILHLRNCVCLNT